jgi:hypothetical protein
MNKKIERIKFLKLMLYFCKDKAIAQAIAEEIAKLSYEILMQNKAEIEAFAKILDALAERAEQSFRKAELDI